MRISYIVATSRNGVIGAKGAIPWYLPADFAYFKATTMGHPVIMGRKTYESIGKPLPGRLNIVVTGPTNFHPEGTRVAHGLNEALRIAEDTSDNEIFIIGGATLFNEAIDRVNRIYLTIVQADIDGDTFFKLDPQGWKLRSKETHQADENNNYDYDFMILERINN